MTGEKSPKWARRDYLRSSNSSCPANVFASSSHELLDANVETLVAPSLGGLGLAIRLLRVALFDLVVTAALGAILALAQVG